MRALAFSGGKDSWACLWLHEHELSDLPVLWVNPGKTYPELLATIERARAMCPRFVEICVDRDGQNSYHGLPSDVVPVNWTREGQLMTCAKPVTVQSYVQCCYENIAHPLMTYCRMRGITELIRGQRLDDGHQSTARDGDVVQGVTFRHPIEQWTTEQVLAFVSSRMELPEHFRFAHSSLDCYDCTAYARESKDRVAWMERAHPLLYRAYFDRALALKSAINASLED